MINPSSLRILTPLCYPLIIFTALSLNIYSAYSLEATVQQRPVRGLWKRSAAQQDIIFASYSSLPGVLQVFCRCWQSPGGGSHTYVDSCGVCGLLISSFPLSRLAVSFTTNIRRLRIPGGHLSQTKWKNSLDWPVVNSISIPSFHFPTWVNYRKGHSRGAPNMLALRKRCGSCRILQTPLGITRQI